MENKTVKISKRELEIAYNIDKKSVQEIATTYGITFQECKAVIRKAGMIVRKGEKPTPVQDSDYTIYLVNPDKTETEVTTTKEVAAVTES